MSRTALCFATLITSFASLAQEPPTPEAAAPAAEAAPAAALPSADDASKVLKVTNVGNAKSIERLAITSCTVLFGTESSANAETQAGFGDSRAKRVEATVSSTYELLGIDAAARQTLTDAICSDAQVQLASRYTMVAQADVAADPLFAKLHANGKPVPFEMARAGTKYQVHAPAGQAVVDLVYQNSDGIGGTLRSFGTIASAISNGGPDVAEGALLKSLNASGAQINVMVDFARQKSNSVKGFLGRIAGNDSAKVDTSLQLSVSGFVRIAPLSEIEVKSGYVLPDVNEYLRLTTKAPLQGGGNAVLGVHDIQSTGSKVGEGAVNVLAGAMALSGISTSMATIERNGVDVDPAIYASEVRLLAGKLVGMAAVLSRP